MELRLRSVESQGGHEAGGAPSTLVDSRWVPLCWFFHQYFFIFQKYSPWIFRSFREFLFLHKNNTKEILLKTISVRVSSIQIMQIRLQNNGKIFWKSRYDGDVSEIPTQLRTSRKNFLHCCWGDIINIYQVPMHILSSPCIYIIFHFPFVFISPTSKKFLQKYKNIFRLPFSYLIFCFLAILFA